MNLKHETQKTKNKRDVTAVLLHGMSDMAEILVSTVCTIGNEHSAVYDICIRDGTLYATDSNFYSILKVTLSGVSTIVGGGIRGHSDGIGQEARFDCPVGICADGDGNLYIVDHGNHCIRKMTPEGVVTTLAGDGGDGDDDGIGQEARFHCPEGICIEHDGNLYVTDTENHCIRKVTPEGVVTTVAGAQRGFADGIGSHARFCEPRGICVDGDGNLYIVDHGNHCIRKVTSEGVVTTLAGDGTSQEIGYADGARFEARFDNPEGICIDGDGNLYVTDACNHCIRKVTPEGVVTTLAGDGGDEAGDDDGVGSAARFNNPTGICISGDGDLYVADTTNTKIRKIAANLTPPLALHHASTTSTVPSTLVHDLASFLADESLSDVTFAVNGEHIRAHRAMLVSRSSYFRTMLTSGFQEAQQQRDAVITIGDSTPAAFRSVLRYLYTDQLICDDDCVVDVLRKGQEIDSRRLCDLCVQYCHRHIVPSSAISWLLQAHENGIDELRALALAYVKRNYRRIRMVARESLLELGTNPELMLEVMDGNHA